jgi:hypothetical protein
MYGSLLLILYGFAVRARWQQSVKTCRIYRTDKSPRLWRTLNRKPTAGYAGNPMELLLDIVRKNAGTEYGQRYGFDKISSIADYQHNVPVISY